MTASEYDALFRDEDDQAFVSFVQNYLARDAHKVRGISAAEYVHLCRTVLGCSGWGTRSTTIMLNSSSSTLMPTRNGTFTKVGGRREKNETPNPQLERTCFARRLVARR